MLKKMLFTILIIMFSLTACSSDVTNKVGDKGYDFEMENYNGESFKLSEFQGRNLYVLAWSTT